VYESQRFGSTRRSSTRPRRWSGAVRAFVGLGANVGDREPTIRRSLALLDASEGVRVVAVSMLRETEPVGVADQRPFLNGAAEIETVLSPRALLERLLAVERELGRDRSAERRWGPRTIDLDLLLYGDARVDEPGLTVPHPRLHERRFALEPLAELDPELELPDGRRVRDLVATAVQ
jgi:2-amino-4-hydroxy-6-hydroxymethyldihydropteridine diphosphokinase